MSLKLRNVKLAFKKLRDTRPDKYTKPIFVGVDPASPDGADAMAMLYDGDRALQLKEARQRAMLETRASHGRAVGKTALMAQMYGGLNIGKIISRHDLFSLAGGAAEASVLPDLPAPPPPPAPIPTLPYLLQGTDLPARAWSYSDDTDIGTYFTDGEAMRFAVEGNFTGERDIWEENFGQLKRQEKAKRWGDLMARMERLNPTR